MHLTKTLILILATGSILVLASKANEPEWYSRLGKLRPLQSSRLDVENVFSSAKLRTSIHENKKLSLFYVESDGKLVVDYTSELCNSGGMQIEKDTVLQMTYYPAIKDKLSIFRMEKKAFVRSFNSHDSHDHYVSTKLGLEFAVFRGRVSYVRVFPSDTERIRDCGASSSIQFHEPGTKTKTSMMAPDE